MGYEIDLSETNAQKFRSTLEKYIKVSRLVERQPALVSVGRGERSATKRRGAGSSGRDDLAEIRAWAQAQGMQVAERGRIKKEIIDEYDQKHK